MSTAHHVHLRPWKPGQSGNPSGRAKLPPELRAIKELSQEEVNRLVAKYGRMDPSEVDALILSRKIPMLELTIARIFQESEKKGDWQRLSFLLDRAIGKVHIVEATPAEADAIREIQDLSDHELLRLVKEKLPELEKAK